MKESSERARKVARGTRGQNQSPLGGKDKGGGTSNCHSYLSSAIEHEVQEVLSVPLNSCSS